MITFLCAKCGNRIIVSDGYAGKKGKCTKCQEVLSVPATSQASSAASRETEADSRCGPRGASPATAHNEPESCATEHRRHEGLDARERGIQSNVGGNKSRTGILVFALGLFVIFGGLLPLYLGTSKRERSENQKDAESNSTGRRRAEGTKAKEADEKVVAGTSDWVEVSVPSGCTFRIPPSLEVQTGLYKEVVDNFKRRSLAITSPGEVVVQPVGTNEISSAAMKRYCRIIVSSERGEFLKQDEVGIFGISELAVLDAQFADQLDQDVRKGAALGVKVDVLSRQPSELVRCGNANAVSAAYSRRINNAPPVFVRQYLVYNTDVVFRITVSYRESENDMWAGDLARSIATFRIAKR